MVILEGVVFDAVEVQYIDAVPVIWSTLTDVNGVDKTIEKLDSITQN